MSDFAPVVTVTPTIQDGTVVRWYRSLASLGAHECAVSVSRNRVSVAADVRDSAEADSLVAAVYRAILVQGRISAGVDVHHLATHETSGLFGPYREVVR